MLYEVREPCLGENILLPSLDLPFGTLSLSSFLRSTECTATQGMPPPNGEMATIFINFFIILHWYTGDLQIVLLVVLMKK